MNVETVSNGQGNLHVVDLNGSRNQRNTKHSNTDTRYHRSEGQMRSIDAVLQQSSNGHSDFNCIILIGCVSYHLTPPVINDQGSVGSLSSVGYRLSASVSTPVLFDVSKLLP